MSYGWQPSISFTASKYQVGPVHILCHPGERGEGVGGGSEDIEDN